MRGNRSGSRPLSEHGAHRRAEQPDRPERRARLRRRRLLAVLIVLALLGVLVVGIYVVGSRFISGLGKTPDYPGPGRRSAQVQVAPGDTLTDVAQTLAHDGVVKSPAAFRNAAKSNAKARLLQPGFYRLRLRMSGAGALALLLDPSSRLRSRVTIPEGTPLTTVLTLTAAKTELSLADLQAAAGQPGALGLPPYANGKAEGFLYPATYEIDPTTSATDALATMVARFNQEAGQINLAEGAQALGRSPYDVVTVASMIEKEAKIPADYPKVARVVYNRLAKSMPLQFDSTINYVLPERKGHLSNADLQTPSPYNTYLHPGLPPGPIDSPGEQALQAALHPAQGDWIYFITIDAQGDSAFTASYPEFLRLKAQAQAKGLL